jgi:hypothetical protein
LHVSKISRSPVTPIALIYIFIASGHARNLSVGNSKEESQGGEKERSRWRRWLPAKDLVEIDAANSPPKLVAQYPWSAGSKEQWRKWVTRAYFQTVGGEGGCCKRKRLRSPKLGVPPS